MLASLLILLVSALPVKAALLGVWLGLDRVCLGVYQNLILAVDLILIRGSALHSLNRRITLRDT